jgi:hypothetical protein
MYSRMVAGKVKYPTFSKRLYPALRQSRIFCTLEKAVQLISKGTGPIWPFVFDEDPTKSLFKIGQVHLEDVKAIVMRVTKAEPLMPEVMEVPATPFSPLYRKANGDRVNFVDTCPVKLQGNLYLHRERCQSKPSIPAMGKDFAPVVDGMMLDYGLDGGITHKDGAVIDSEAVLEGGKGYAGDIDSWCQRALAGLRESV